jgi:hypothetical protein
MKLITVQTAFNPADAQLVNSRLQAAGFHSVVMGEMAALSMDGYAITAGGIRVQVPEDEVADALLLLNGEESPEDGSKAD